jgi:long-subunit fatty acid transport protein
MMRLNRKMKSLVFFGALLMLGPSASAQNETDVARFISTDFGGTARFNGMGGAMGALGGDASTLMYNPAGMGVYRSSEFSISPTFVPMSSSTSFYGSDTRQGDFNVNLNNFGYIRATELKDKGQWKMVQFGLSYIPLKNLNTNHTIQGRHRDGSLSQEIASDAMGLDPNNFESNDPFFIFPAYQTYLIDPDTSTTAFDYISAIPVGTLIEQKTVLNRRGRIGETVFAASCNYNDKLYLGAALGYNKVVYDEFMDYQELVVDTGVTDLKGFTMVQDVEVRGSGIDLKVGAIYKVTDMLRLGASYTSPTWNYMTTSWNTSITTGFNDGSSYTQSAAAIGANDYYMTAPSRLMGSIALVLGKHALLDIDYEFVDYSGAKLRSFEPNPIDFSAANSEIQNSLVSVGNIRTGLEIRHQGWSLRGGYAVYPDPYRPESKTNDASKNIISAGLGFKKEQVSIDMAIKNTSYGSDYFAYASDGMQAAQVDERQTAIIMTFGLRF